MKFTEEYNDPILYDKENDSYQEDVSYLLKWASKTGGPIIDLACGTGRAAIPLASKGHRLIGVDAHSGMLNLAREKSAGLGLQIEWVEQDCRGLSLNVKSPFMFSVGNSFQHFLTNEDQDDFLSSVNKHLERGGIFVFGSRFPSVEELLQPAEEEYWKTYIDPVSQNKVDVYTISTYDSLSQIQHYITIRKFYDSEGMQTNEKRTSINLRYVFPREMERLLLNNGMEIVHVFSDWQETPVRSDSYEMVYVCRKMREI
ncbi:class I SAM-dependent methyltransferase [Cytobacillus oceanisediminis]|uniref:Methyltransferase n=1 Tax=Cytobacillus oceanisediminis 2691 TaxID=1196031 RepID=A0A160M6P4_9BACI|nr:class I SAM-dependent methyltransferase [Cytobacillus oceanisediminis]AND38107.1 methyltransferase [Cytobacillus oceanisediminis 2691]MCM3245115.1 class I SAM-dependent methyltransferase [Cytobacillus oceanisediminis]MCS0825320.1 class I SAM-dependent methyltransferase [Cytobacillus firmus]